MTAAISDALGKLSPETYRSLQDAVSRQLLSVAYPLIQSLLGREIVSADLAMVTNTLFPAVQVARSDSEQLADGFYKSQRRGHVGLAPLATAPPLEVYNPKFLLGGLRRVLTPGREIRSVAAPLGTIVRHAEAAGRNRIAGLSLVDDECEGWARKARGAKTCSFCTMLISRGPVYKSRQSAGDMKKFHDACDCQIVPVFDRNNFPGRQQFLDAEQLWIESTRGKGGKEALSAFRAANHAPDGRDVVEIAG